MVRKRQNTKIRQVQIVEAAKKVIIKYGSEHLTVKRIAGEVGISETAIYRHFKSKKDILSLMADHIEAGLVGDIEKAIRDIQGSPLVILENVLNNSLSTVEQRRGISFQVIAEVISLGDKKLNKKTTEIINKYISSLKYLLDAGVKTGEVREDIDREAAAVVLFGMIQGLVNIWALSSYKFDLLERYLPLWQVYKKAIAGAGS